MKIEGEKKKTKMTRNSIDRNKNAKIGTLDTPVKLCLFFTTTVRTAVAVKNRQRINTIFAALRQSQFVILYVCKFWTISFNLGGSS